MAVRVLSEAGPTPFIPPAPVIRAPVPSSPPSPPPPLPALLGRCTAINNEFTAGDKRRLLGGEIHHAIGDIGGRARSAAGGTPLPLFPQGGGKYLAPAGEYLRLIRPPL